MTNKDYDRLTFQPSRHGGIICGIGLKANSEEIAERLYALEEMIENGALVFLPCKVGDTVWFVNEYRLEKPIEAYIVDTIILRSGIISIEVHQAEVPYGAGLIRNDYFGRNVFTTKEAAEKALEELK